MAEDPVHSRPDQAEEPVVDVGASNVDLDEARHDDSHESPAAPEPAHDPDAPGHDTHDAHADHGHDTHDDDHVVEDPRWVLLPLAAGLVVAVVLIAVLGLAAAADPFHYLG